MQVRSCMQASVGLVGKERGNEVPCWLPFMALPAEPPGVAGGT